MSKLPIAETVIPAAIRIRDEIIALAAGSEIARYGWLDNNNQRGPTFRGYAKGMALSYARVYCKFKAGHPAALEMAKAKVGDAESDSFARLEETFTANGLNNDVAGIECLRNVFVLLWGLGARESTGRYCEGRYTHDDFPGADEAEAGLFQSAYLLSEGRTHYAPLLQGLVSHYTANPQAGFLEVFQEGVTCNDADWKSWGEENTPGWRYQHLAKACPAFSVEFTGVAVRNRPTHWGPIKRRYVEIAPVCRTLLIGIEQLVDRPPGFCAEVL